MSIQLHTSIISGASSLSWLVIKQTLYVHIHSPPHSHLEVFCVTFKFKHRPNPFFFTIVFFHFQCNKGEVSHNQHYVFGGLEFLLQAKCFCYKTWRYWIHSVNRKFCYFVFDLSEVQLSAAWAWSNSHSVLVLWVLWPQLSTHRGWRQWLMLLLSCSYGELDEYCGASRWDCAGYNKAKRKAPFELQLIGQRDYPCMSLWTHQVNSNSHHPESLNTTHWSSSKRSSQDMLGRFWKMI